MRRIYFPDSCTEPYVRAFLYIYINILSEKVTLIETKCIPLPSFFCILLTEELVFCIERGVSKRKKSYLSALERNIIWYFQMNLAGRKIIYFGISVFTTPLSLKIHFLFLCIVYIAGKYGKSFKWEFFLLI